MLRRAPRTKGIGRAGRQTAITLLVTLVVTACSRPRREPTAIQIEDPNQHWQEGGFVEMVTPLEPPTSADGRDRITVWLKIPDGGRIGLARSLRYPPGTIADRVEYLGDEIVDVRGTRFVEAGADGAELFHVLRRRGPALAGYEWRRGDADLARRATELALPLVDESERETFRRNNDCESCHQPDLPPATRGRAARPRRATDSNGLYQMLAVLSDSAPLDQHRAHEVNVERPFVRVECPLGASPWLKDGGGGRRHYVCAGGGVPIGHVDVERARLDGDARALAVCRSRRYLMEHMDAAARAAFEPVFRACGVDSSLGRPPQRAQTWSEAER
jgi:hypothetical protein